MILSYLFMSLHVSVLRSSIRGWHVDYGRWFGIYFCFKEATWWAISDVRSGSYELFLRDWGSTLSKRILSLSLNTWSHWLFRHQWYSNGYHGYGSTPAALTHRWHTSWGCLSISAYCGQSCLSYCHQIRYCSCCPYFELVCECSYLRSFWIFTSCAEILQGNLIQRLFYARDSPLQLYSYSDCTWDTDRTDRCSITGYCILLGSSFLAWKSLKQVAYLSLVHRQNFEHWLLLLADFGISYDAPPHLFSVIIQEPYKMLMILWSMDLQSILELTPPLLGLIIIRKPLLYSMCPLSCS